MAVRHKASEEKMRQIYSVALALFKEKGFDNTRISDICKAAGVPVGSVYNFFENKEAFLRKYAKSLGEQGHHILVDSSLDKDPIEVLYEYYLYKARTLEEAGVVVCRSIDEKFDELWLKAGRYNALAGVSCLTPFIQTRIDAGQLKLSRSAEEASWLMQALFRGCVSHWLRVSDGISLVELTRDRFLPIVVENLTHKIFESPQKTEA